MQLTTMQGGFGAVGWGPCFLLMVLSAVKAGDRQQGPHFPGHADVASQRHSGLEKKNSLRHGDQVWGRSSKIMAHIGPWSKAGGKQALEGTTFTFAGSEVSEVSEVLASQQICTAEEYVPNGHPNKPWCCFDCMKYHTINPWNQQPYSWAVQDGPCGSQGLVGTDTLQRDDIYRFPRLATNHSQLRSAAASVSVFDALGCGKVHEWFSDAFP